MATRIVRPGLAVSISLWTVHSVCRPDPRSDNSWAHSWSQSQDTLEGRLGPGPRSPRCQAEASTPDHMPGRGAHRPPGHRQVCRSQSRHRWALLLTCMLRVPGLLGTCEPEAWVQGLSCCMSEPGHSSGRVQTLCPVPTAPGSPGSFIQFPGAALWFVCLQRSLLPALPSHFLLQVFRDAGGDFCSGGSRESPGSGRWGCSEGTVEQGARFPWHCGARGTVPLKLRSPEHGSPWHCRTCGTVPLALWNLQHGSPGTVESGA